MVTPVSQIWLHRYKAMSKRVTYTLVRDWHAAGIATVLMGLIILSATFPWGRWFYTVAMTDSFTKTAFGLICSYFMFKPILRTPLTALWFIVKPTRENHLLNRLVCAPDALRKGEGQIDQLKKTAFIQYAAMTAFLASAGIALILSVYIALGAASLSWFNNTVLVVGIITVFWAVLLQLYIRFSKLQKSSLLKRLLLFKKNDG